MVTIREIAEKCGVSVATVSNILNGRPKVREETKQRVLAVIKEEGYQPSYMARGLRTQKTKMIGIIVEDIVQFSTAPVVEGVMAYCEDRGYNVVMENLRFYSRWQNLWKYKEDEYKKILQAAINDLLSIKVDGIIYIACHTRVIPCFPEDFDIPGVVAYAHSAIDRFPSIVIDDVKGGYDMTKYLVENGHRKIGVVAGARDNVHTQNRLHGYQQALFEAGLLYNPDWISYADWEPNLSYIETQRLLDNGVTAIFALSDRMAGGVYSYLYKSEINIGEDISLAGYDDMEMSRYLKPGLTTVQLPLNQIGNRSADLLIEQIESKPDKTIQYNTEIKIPCTVIVRESVKNIS